MKKIKFYVALLALSCAFCDVDGQLPAGFIDGAELKNSLQRGTLDQGTIQQQAQLRLDMLNSIGYFDTLGEQEREALRRYANANIPQLFQDRRVKAVDFLKDSIDPLLQWWVNEQRRTYFTNVSIYNVQQQIRLRYAILRSHNLNLNEAQKIILGAVAGMSPTNLRYVNMDVVQRLIENVMDQPILMAYNQYGVQRQRYQEQWEQRARDIPQQEMQLCNNPGFFLGATNPQEERNFGIRLASLLEDEADRAEEVQLPTQVELINRLSAEDKSQLGIRDGQSIRQFIDGKLAFVERTLCFDQNTPEHNFFNMLHLIAELALEAAENANMRPALKVLCRAWIDAVKPWCKTNFIMPADEIKIRFIVDSLNADCVGADNIRLINGTESGIEGGLGSMRLSVLNYSHNRVGLLGYVKQLVGAQSIAEAKVFLDSLEPYNRPVLEMLALKPILMHGLLHPEGRRSRTEEQIVSFMMPDIFDTLSRFQILKNCFIKSSFGSTFSPDIFLALLKRSIPGVPDNAKPVEIFFAGKKGSFDEGKKVLKYSKLYGEGGIWNRDVIGGVQIQVQDRLVTVPELLFPLLEVQPSSGMFRAQFRVQPREAAKIDIEDYNAFVRAFQKHLKQKAVDNDGSQIETSPCTFEELQAFTPHPGFVDMRLIKDRSLFDRFSRALFGDGIFGYEKDNKGNDFEFVAGPGNIRDGIREPYVKLVKNSPDGGSYLEYLKGIDARLENAVLENIYRISFVRMLLESDFVKEDNVTYIRNYDIEIENVRNAMLVGYRAMHDVDRLDGFGVVRDNAHYDISRIEHFIPQAHLNALQDDQDLRGNLLYYIYKGLYLILTEDDNLERHYDANGNLIEHGGVTFPANYNYGEVINLHKTLLGPLLHRLYCEAERVVNNVTPRLKTASISNDETMDLNTDTVDGRKNLFNNIWKNLVGQYGGIRGTIIGNRMGDIPQFASWNNVISSTTLPDVMGRTGIFFNKSVVKFIVSCLKQKLDNTPPNVVEFWMGMLLSRYSHCQNGRVEGTSKFFPLALGAYNFAENLNFTDLMNVFCSIAVRNIISRYLDFSRTWGGEDFNEEANASSYAMSLIGEDGGMFGITSIDGLNQHIAIGSLQANYIANILKKLRPAIRSEELKQKIYAIQSINYKSAGFSLDLGRGCWKRREQVQGYFTPEERSYLQLLCCCYLETPSAITEELRAVITRVRDETLQKEIETYCQIYAIVGQCNGTPTVSYYKSMLKRIVEYVVTPSRIVEELMKDDNALRMILNAYKTYKGRTDASIAHMNPQQLKGMLLDALVDFGVLTPPPPGQQH